MDHIREILPNISKEKNRKTERGELMKYFMDKLNPPRAAKGMPPLSMGRMGKILQAIPTKDLYYLQSVCDKSDNFSKRFWWEVNPDKHKENSKSGYKTQ